MLKEVIKPIHTLNKPTSSDCNNQNLDHLEQENDVLNAIINTARDAIVIIDDNGLIRLWNPSAEQLFGWTNKEALGKNVHSLIAPEAYHHRGIKSMEKFKVTGRGNTINSRLELEGKHKDGQIFPIEISLSEMKYNDKIGIISIIHDISERKKKELYQDLNRRVLAILNRTEDFKDLIDLLLTTVRQATNCDAVGIRLEQNKDYPYFAQQGFSDNFMLTENSLIADNFNKGICLNQDGTAKLECICGSVISGKTDTTNPLFTTGGSAWSNNSLSILDLTEKDDPRLNPRNKCIHDGFASIAIIPIRVREKIIGLIQLNHKKENQFNFDAINSLEIMANYIGEALLREQTSQKLLEKEKLEGILEMAGTICHEINQPLQVLVGQVELLLIDTKEKKEINNKDLERLDTQVKRLATLTHKISRITRYAPKPYVGNLTIIDIDKSSK